MLLDDWHDYWRVLNTLLGLVGFIFLLMRYLGRDWGWRPVVGGLWFGCVAGVLACFVSSIEGIFLDAPLAIRVPLVTVQALIILFVAARRDVWDDA